MNAERWRRVVEIFDAARSQPPEERERFVDREVGGDEELRSEVLSLLRSDARARGFLSQPLADLAPETAADATFAEGALLGGRYRILRYLGRGGMGSVYLASRADEAYRGEVAIKVVRRDRIDSEQMRRFQSERQILADLRHPNIAGMLDAGTTEDGRPFLVLEHIEGPPIDRYCTEGGLTVEARLELFAKVAHAVQAAHQNLIVHRDLKPANILIDQRSGEPKLLDFGIAKPLRPAELASGVTTEGPAPLTLEYASPEQLARRPLTTASDVYALGVLLYELLVGQRPFELGEQRTDELIRDICERPPTLPSRRVLQAAQSAAEGEGRRRLERLGRRLAGDLDSIVMRALAKDPERRYGSALELARDLERHAGHLPVRARPDSLAYRTTRFLSRHRWASTAATLALVSLMAFTAALFRSRQEAREQQLISEQVLDMVIGIFEAANPEPSTPEPGLRRELARTPHDVSARDLLEIGRSYFMNRNRMQPALSATLAMALGLAHHHLGWHEEAEPLLIRALEEYRDLHGPGHELVVEAEQALAAHWLEIGEYAAAAEAYRASLEQPGKRSPSTEVRGWIGLSKARIRLDWKQQAEEAARRALRAAIAQGGSDAGLRARALHQLAKVQRVRGERRDAQTSFLQAEQAYRASPENHESELAVLDIDLGLLLYNLHEWEGSETRFRQALKQRRDIYGDHHLRVAECLHNLGLVKRARGQQAEAEKLAREAYDIRLAFDPDHPRVTLSLELLGQLDGDRGAHAEAEEKLRQVLKIRRAALVSPHEQIAAAHSNLAAALRAQKRCEEALESYRAAVDIYLQTNGEESLPTARARHNLVHCLLDTDRLSEAEEQARLALRGILTQRGGAHVETGDVRLTLALVLRKKGDLAEAEDQGLQALAIYEEAPEAPDFRIGLAQARLARTLQLAGHLSKALDRVRKALKIYSVTLEEDHDWVLTARELEEEIAAALPP